MHRIVRIVSVPGMREVRLEELGKMLLGRGYKAGDIKQAIEFGVKMDREETIEKVIREHNKNKGRVRYTITYDPKLPHLPAILSKNWNVLVDSDRRLNKAFPAPPMASLKRGPNLQDKLIRARVAPLLG